jgi:hypothetical protein
MLRAVQSEILHVRRTHLRPRGTAAAPRRGTRFIVIVVNSPLTRMAPAEFDEQQQRVGLLEGPLGYDPDLARI